jgi:hypothetical protein
LCWCKNSLQEKYLNVSFCCHAQGILYLFFYKTSEVSKKLNIFPTNENLSKHKVVEMGPPWPTWLSSHKRCHLIYLESALSTY